MCSHVLSGELLSKLQKLKEAHEQAPEQALASKGALLLVQSVKERGGGGGGGGTEWTRKPSVVTWAGFPF
jgi:hypothetical protein